MLSDPVLSASGGFENDFLPAGCLRRSR